ncbi:hypothetical protein ACFC00_03905 [Streptomyces adustus]
MSAIPGSLKRPWYSICKVTSIMHACSALHLVHPLSLRFTAHQYPPYSYC